MVSKLARDQLFCCIRGKLILMVLRNSRIDPCAKHRDIEGDFSMVTGDDCMLQGDQVD